MTVYRYRTSARWTASRKGEVGAESVFEPLVFSAPTEFGGEPNQWTPEHMFVAAVSSCFVTTFGVIAGLSKFPFAELEVTAEGVLEKEEGGYRFTQVILRPMLTLEREEDRERGLRLLEKAERSCLIARSISAQMVLEPQLHVLAPV
ncbi:MAG: OsmC family protein [Terriglobales bacterium]